MLVVYSFRAYFLGGAGNRGSPARTTKRCRKVSEFSEVSLFYYFQSSSELILSVPCNSHFKGGEERRNSGGSCR